MSCKNPNIIFLGSYVKTVSSKYEEWDICQETSGAGIVDNYNDPLEMGGRI